MEREPPPWRIVRWASYLGSRSYSIYLWHAAVAVVAAKIWTARSATAGASSWYLYFVAYIAASLGVGLAMATLIEFPILALRDREAPATAAPLSR